VKGNENNLNISIGSLFVIFYGLTYCYTRLKTILPNGLFCIW